jgi:YfiH family protein
MSVLLQSPRWLARGVRHGFSLRTGGVSAAPFTSLNLARNVGDHPDAVVENQRRFAEAVGYDPECLYEVSQVHGGRVLATDAAPDPAAFRELEADALITDLPGHAVGVRVADCVAVLLRSDDGRVVGAVHSGWRGTVANVVGAAVDALVARAGIPTESVHALVCPHIGVGAFEVGPEVVEAMSRALPGVHGLVQSGGHKPHVNLGRAIESQLRNAGVPLRQIEQLAGCTHAEAGRFFSFRRDGRASGRHLAAIVAGC